MKHPIYKIRDIEQVGSYLLKLSFDDGLTRTIDFEPVLHGEIFGPLRDPAEFAKFRLDPEIRTVVWQNGADFDPATLHDWPAHQEAFRSAAERWKLSETALNARR